MVGGIGDKHLGASEQARQSVDKLCGDCEFIRWCRDNQADVSEALWYSAISNVARISPGGPALCHEISKGHPEYSHKETAAKILHALNDTGPHTCDYINVNGFSCSQLCPVTSPIGHLFRSNIRIEIPVDDTRNWPEPVPLPDSLPPVKTLEPEMLPEPFKDWIMDIAERMQCPPDFIAAAAIVAAGSLIGTGCCIYPKAKDNWYEFPNLWGAAIGRSALFKTPATNEATTPLRRLAADATNEYQEALAEYEQRKFVGKAQKEVLEVEIKKALKDGKDPMGLFSSIDKITPPVEKRYLTQDGTIEKIGELLVDNPRGILVNRDEVAGFLRSLDKPGREGDRAFYLEAWNGKGHFTYDRIGRGTLHIPALCLSIFGSITPGALSEYVAGAIKEGRGDDGLVQRFQVSVYPDASPDWRNVDRYPDTEQKNRAYEIFKKLSEDKIYNSLTGEPKGLRFDAEAQELFNEWRADLEARLRRGDLIPAMESHLAKYRKLIPCLSLIFHLVEMADGKASGNVSERSFIQAAAWGEYLESHAVRIYDAASSFDMMVARELLKHLLAGEIKDGEALREIYRKYWLILRLFLSDCYQRGFQSF